MVMRLLTTQRSDSTVEAWANTATAVIDSWLTADGVEPIVRRLVHGWNDGGGVGVQLADELEDLVRTRMQEAMSPFFIWWRLRNVNWNQLAEQYALRYCSITEEDLVRRRESYLQ